MRRAKVAKDRLLGLANAHMHAFHIPVHQWKGIDGGKGAVQKNCLT